MTTAADERLTLTQPGRVTYDPSCWSDLRWNVEIDYRSEIDITHTVYMRVDELGDVHDIIEGGPDFNCVQRIIVTLNKKHEPSLSIEEVRRRENER